jgi:hypothetical protein
MIGSYPRARCPGCKKAFRMEIKRSATFSPSLGMIACPYCGLKFQRFDTLYLKAPSRRLPTGNYSNFN